MSAPPRLWLTSTCAAGNVDNITEMVEPVLPHLDGIIWALNDCSADDSGARYLESVKGTGRILHRPWAVGRHNVSMNETLYTGLLNEGDYIIWSDLLEHPAPAFIRRVKSEIGPMMEAADLDVVAYYGKPYLMRYRETMEYKGSPHWHLEGWNGRAIEWSKIEGDEKLVRFNARPLKRTGQHWAEHYGKYWVYPEGTNHALLGLDHWPLPSPHLTPEQVQQVRAQQFTAREERRLEFRREMVRRGVPLTLEGLKSLLAGPLDDILKEYLRAEKTLSDLYHLGRGQGELLKDTHRPEDALPIL